jgi:hypothetical protein
MDERDRDMRLVGVLLPGRISSLRLSRSADFSQHRLLGDLRRVVSIGAGEVSIAHDTSRGKGQD